MKVKMVVVGSANPTKLAAAKDAFTRVFPQLGWKVVNHVVASGIRDQPLSFEETLAGAKNRADRAFEASNKTADFSVGLEGGVQRIGEHWFDCGWAYVRDKEGEFGIGSGGHMLLPPEIVAMVESGHEVSTGVDRLFGLERSKHEQGLGGCITSGLYPLREEYALAIIIALARFITPNAYTT
jgi:inosine/xanthosine triphosphatase